MKKDYLHSMTDGEQLEITTYGDPSKCDAALICVHGFKGFKDWGFWPVVGNYFSNEGLFIITFNFSHNGVGLKSKDFNELDKFAKNTFSREVHELKELIEATVSGYFESVKFRKIYLLGHSRGGAVSILSSWNNPNINKLVTWASIAKLDRYSERQKKEWKEKGYWEILNTRTKQLMRLNYSLLEDILQNKDTSLNLERAVRELEIPYLILHGDQDLAVPADEAKQLYEWANKENTQIHIIENTGHTFDIKHPFETTNSKFEQLLSLTLNFLKN